MTTEPLTLDTVFRCEKFTCLLAVKACLRRQTEMRRKLGRAGGKHFVREFPMHPHCAGGTCEQGNTHRAAFPGHVPEAARDPRLPPRLDLVNQETTAMPKGQLNQKRTCCDTKGGRHKADCTGKPGPKPVVAKVTRAPALRAVPRRGKPAAGGGYGYLADETHDELVNALMTIDRTRAAVVAEMERRAAALELVLRGPAKIPAQQGQDARAAG